MGPQCKGTARSDLGQQQNHQPINLALLLVIAHTTCAKELGCAFWGHNKSATCFDFVFRVPRLAVLFA